MAGLMARATFRRSKSTDAARSATTLLYLGRPAAGKRTGRNIGGPHSNTASDLEAVHLPVAVKLRDWRRVHDPPSLANDGFELTHLEPAEPEADFSDHAVLKELYARVEQLVQSAVGADRVIVFDHTLRLSGVEGLNSLDGKSAAGAVIRVHGDYTPASGPVRLQRLVDDGTVALRGEASGARFAFVNVWQSIDERHPVLQHPLALCRPRSIEYAADTWPYHMHFAERTGQNLACEARAAHEWGYFPRMTCDEAIVFVTYDSERAHTGVGVVHTAFEDASIDGAGVPRRSVELRTVAIWDGEHQGGAG